MIYTPKTREAMKIAYEAHNGQLDKSGVPYIYHPIHLAEQMQTEEEVIVALLHDTVEDTEVTFEQLEKVFSYDIIIALKLLTHNKSIEYMDYVKAIKDNLIARKVKLADLCHNSEESRLEYLTDKDEKRIQKYKKAIEILSK